MGKKLEDYLGTDPQQLMALIAFKVDDMCDQKFPEVNTHLKRLNNRVDKNARAIMKIEAKAEVEKEYGLVKLPMNKKKMVAVGGMSIALIGLVIYVIPIIVDLIRGVL